MWSNTTNTTTTTTINIAVFPNCLKTHIHRYALLSFLLLPLPESVFFIYIYFQFKRLFSFIEYWRKYCIAIIWLINATEVRVSLKRMLAAGCLNVHNPKTRKWKWVYNWFWSLMAIRSVFNHLWPCFRAPSK
jgi:hypothetical protein